MAHFLINELANLRFCDWCGDVLDFSDDLVCGYHWLEE